MIRRLGALALVAAAMTACETGVPYGAGGGGGVSFVEGSLLADQVSGEDLRSLYSAFVTAVESGPAGQPVKWRGERASGSVTPGRYLVGNLLPDERATLPVAAPLQLSTPLQTEQGPHVLTRNSNLRAGPSTEAKVLGQLPSGTGVEAIGKVASAPWMLVATDGAVRGYIHESLMIKAPGSELLLAGGPVRRPHLCRAFQQQLSVSGRSDQWSGVACDRGEGWRLEPKDENAPQRLF